jgi:ATP/maltotriose-dependent transcriptional regulator MalT/DNA-binding SARP family transcriptional activator
MPGRSTPPTVIASKLEPPPPPTRLVARARLDELVNRLVDEHRVIWVCATAGAGKTTAVLQAMERHARARAWLTLEATDRAPGRLLTYLEAALVRSAPSLAGTTAAALAERIPHAEVAGLLAAAVDQPTVLVIDQVERLDEQPKAVAVLAHLVRHASEHLRLVFISRRNPVAGISATAPPGPVVLGERELAFDRDEAAAALDQAGTATIDPDDAVRMTGGWVTGVLFEAWRSEQHVTGHGGEADALHGYLATEILARLSQADRDFLVTCSVLDRVDVASATAIGVADAGARLASLRASHLPATWDADGSLRCHTRFRDFLVTCLRQRGEGLEQRVRRGHARLLAGEGHDEDAVEEYLRAGAPEEAVDSVERAIAAVVERLDFPVAERWLREVRPFVGSERLGIAAGELLLAIGQEQHARAAALGDELAARGLRDALLQSHGRAMVLLAWCYFHVGRVPDAVAILDAGAALPEAELARLLLTVVDQDDTDLALPRPSGGPLDGLLMRLRYAHGKLTDAHDLPASRFAVAMSVSFRIAALRAAGATEQALELLESAPADEHESGPYDLAGCEVYADLGRADDAWASLSRARERITRNGSSVFLLLSLAVEAKLELRLNADGARAEAVLDAFWRHPNGRTYRFISEQADTWHGRLLLERGEDAAAAERLEQAVRSMVAGDRILELPAAAVYLAEAMWRLGDEDAADRAADVALEAATRQGADFGLLQALTEYPAVAARRIDTEAGRESAWHGVGRRLVAQGRVSIPGMAPTVVLRDLGDSAIEVDGVRHGLRIKKSYELLAFLLTRPERAASRAEVLDALFEGRVDDSARSYLRQAIRELRSAAGELLAVDDHAIAISPGIVVTSSSARALSLLEEAERMTGERRIDRVVDALGTLRAEFLPGAGSAWVEARRSELRDIWADGQAEAATLAYQHGRYADAEQLLRDLLDVDPLRESCWRLRIRLAHELGDGDALLVAYRRCCRALGEFGLEPSEATRALIRQLRAEASPYSRP